MIRENGIAALFMILSCIVSIPGRIWEDGNQRSLYGLSDEWLYGINVRLKHLRKCIQGKCTAKKGRNMQEIAAICAQSLETLLDSLNDTVWHSGTAGPRRVPYAVLQHEESV